MVHLTRHGTEWVKFGKIQRMSFIGKDMICFANGCYIIFINLITNEEYLFHASSRTVGEGVSCLAGHKTLPILAFAEKCRYPKIMVITSENFEIIIRLNKHTIEDYLAIAFSEGDYLVSVSDGPSYGIIVWNWRSGLKIALMERRDICGQFQIIKCNFSNPIHFAQVQTGSSGAKLNLWNMAVCGRTCVLSPHAITTPEVPEFSYSDILWTTEGTLFVLDKFGHVYALGSDNKLTRVITWDGTGKVRTSFTWFKAGLMVAGPNGRIKHFTKSGDWFCDSVIMPPKPVEKMFANYGDFLIGLSVEGDVMTYNAEKENFLFRTVDNHGDINDVCLIYPVGDYVLTLQHSRDLTLWNVSDGKMLQKKRLKGIALAINSNPEYPYVGVAFADGVLQLVSVYNHKKMNCMCNFNLTRKPLNHVSFTRIGKLIIVANMDIGEFYIIEGIPGSHMQVIGSVRAHNQICDYMLVASKTCMRLFTIPVTSKNFISGNRIVRYCILRDKLYAEVKTYRLETKYQMYSKIYETSRTNRDRVFYAIPLAGKCIHEITTKRGSLIAKVTRIFDTDHQMQKVILHIDVNYIVTYAFDGLVIVRDKNFKKKRAVIMPHYRTFGGVIKAYVDPLGRYVVSLGRDNTLVCTNLGNKKIDPKKRDLIQRLRNSKRLALLFTRPTIGFIPTEKGEKGKTWWAIQKKHLRAKEAKMAEKERRSILEDFKVLRAEVRDLFDTNLNGPANELLEIQEFNLDVGFRNQQVKKCRRDCEYLKTYMEATIKAQDKVSKWIRKMCWNNIRIQGQQINGIFDNFEIHNYALIPTEKIMMQRVHKLNVYRTLELKLADQDTFQPWEPKSVREVKLKSRKAPRIAKHRKKKVAIVDLVKKDEPAQKVEKFDIETETAFRGSVAHRYIPVADGHYNQQQASSFLQTEMETLYSLMDVYRLKTFYNKQFNVLMRIKEREIKALWDKNSKLRHIISELNYFSIEQFEVDVIDPVWAAAENPKTIMVVKNSEVQSKPYISPKQRAYLKAILAERERLRLLSLADDFRERALMAMMNGVLEVRWEDELRKNVPRPKCVLEKDPEKFNEDDLRAIVTYNEDVIFLNSERDRYIKILQGDHAKVSNNIRDGIRKFNNRLNDALLVKLKLDSGIRQENLKISRIRLNSLKRIQLNEKEVELQKAIDLNEREIVAVNGLIIELQKSVKNLRTQADTVKARDKLIEQGFKKQFAESSPILLEHALKIYKKRGKVSIRTITSITLTQEISRCIRGVYKSKILTPECYEYLKSVDVLDEFVSVTSAIETHLYNAICLQRRVKMENEIKLRAVNMQIQEAENTVKSYQKLVQDKEDHGEKLLSDLAKMRKDRLRFFHDIELQLVLREGIVEVPRTGKISDFDDVILISRRDVLTINSIIMRAGNRKIKAMRDSMDFRRGILAKEWEHKRLQMQIADLQEYIKDIEAVKVSKEIQAHLKNKKRGFSPEKVSFEEEVELLKAQYIRQINECKAQVSALQNKISSLKQKGKQLQGENQRLNEEVTKLNVDICEFQLERDVAMEQREKKIIKTRMATLLKRSKLIKQIQKNHSDILMLQTELELLRLKTYPTLSYTIIS